jgi:3-oxoacyl-[acyl-carrier protein] reductase|nr:SDR family oxidoreductase [uncultured Acetatifactor sp.]
MLYNDTQNRISVNVNIGHLTPSELLKGHVILITGATGGMGKAISKKCVTQGAKVILADKEERKLHELQKEIGYASHSVCFDIRDISQYHHVFEDADAFFGNIDCIVNNAGVSYHEGDFMNVTEESWDVQMEINLKAPYFLTQEWIRYYRRKNMKSGRIVMMASDTSGMGSTIPYGLSKAGISSFTYGLAKRLIIDGVRVNAIAPGTTLTPMTDDFTHGEVCRATTQGKRALFPEEIAELCVFLLSDLSTCVSGNVFGCSEANICFNNVEREQETNP